MHGLEKKISNVLVSFQACNTISCVHSNQTVLALPEEFVSLSNTKILKIKVGIASFCSYHRNSVGYCAQSISYSLDAMTYANFVPAKSILKIVTILSSLTEKSWLPLSLLILFQGPYVDGIVPDKITSNLSAPAEVVQSLVDDFAIVELLDRKENRT